MKIFALELSSKIGSMALIENGKTVREESWEENFKNRQELFDALDGMKMDWDAVDCFVAGRGPGAFSGMRISFSVINSLAAPGGRAVYAHNSGAALAAQYGAAVTAVVGDARRNKVWAGVFEGAELKKEFALLEYDELADFIPADALVLSSDYDRLEDRLKPFRTAEPAGPVYPAAGVLGELVAQRLEQGLVPENFEPLYMHPAVFVKPKFVG